MNKVVEFLNANPVQYLATVGRDGKAKCRPFMFSGEMDGKLWFCTNNTKDVYKDMQENPEVEISVSSPEYAWILLPLFETFMPLDQLIASFGTFLPFIHTKLDVVLFNAFPFNLLKGLVIGGFTMLTYKRLAPLLKGR